MALGTIEEEERGSSQLTGSPDTLPRMELSEKLSKFIIEARCTDNVLFSAAASVGGFVLFLQSFPIILNNWVYLTEPRPINKTNENGEQVEAVFNYNVGYLQLCRKFVPDNLFNNAISYSLTDIDDNERDYQCHLNPLITRHDLSDFSVASIAVSLRLGLPTLLHVSGAFICCLAFVLGFTGHLKNTAHTLLSAVCYICGCIILSTAVLMFVCVVDDELSPRMKPNAAGEPSKFTFHYGYPFFSSAMSFLPVQFCACMQAFLYFRRYPSVVQKLKYVPGLEEKCKKITKDDVRHAQLDKELGIPPVEILKRGSLASYIPFPSFAMASNRPSPTRSSQASLRNNSIIFVQEV